MKPQHVMYFTEKEKEFVSLLIATGTRKNVAQVLVFLANVPNATSRDIERGTDLRQPEVSLAMHFLISKDWIKIKENKAEGKGRPVKIYALSKPIEKIMNSIEKDKKDQAKQQLARVQKLREYIT
ncbi:MAG TPA: ArsR family transcriptional regulator [Methanoregula sp.]|nr:ArsR family transcriptional regulator [Methanoregula sp.]